jgi:hypothetical protein
MQSPYGFTGAELTNFNLKNESLATGKMKCKENARVDYLLSKLSSITIPTPVKPLESFTLFPRILFEIRTKIWELLSTQSRKVKLFFDIGAYIIEETRTIDGQSKIPAVLHICKESRTEGLRFYTLCKESVVTAAVMEHAVNQWTNHLYINFDVDHFLFQHPPDSPRGCNFNFKQEVLKKIKFVDAHLFQARGNRSVVISELVSFEEFALGRFLMVAESLVAFRFVITANDYRQILSPSTLPGVNVLDDLLTRDWMQNLLAKRAVKIVEVVGFLEGGWFPIPDDGRGRLVRSEAKRNQRIVMMCSGLLLKSEIWDHTFKELATFSCVETFVCV